MKKKKQKTKTYARVAIYNTRKIVCRENNARCHHPSTESTYDALKSEKEITIHYVRVRHYIYTYMWYCHNIRINLRLPRTRRCDRLSSPSPSVLKRVDYE